MNTRFVLFCFCFSLLLMSGKITLAKGEWMRVDSLANAGNFSEALHESLNQLERIEQSGSCAEIAFACLTVGRQHYYLKQKEKAISWFKKSNVISLDCQTDSITGKNFRNIGAIYWEFGNSDSAAYYLEVAQPYLRKAGQPKELSTLFAVLFELHFRSFKDAKAGQRMLDSCRKYSFILCCARTKVSMPFF